MQIKCQCSLFTSSSTFFNLIFTFSPENAFSTSSSSEYNCITSVVSCIDTPTTTMMHTLFAIYQALAEVSTLKKNNLYKTSLWYEAHILSWHWHIYQPKEMTVSICAMQLKTSVHLQIQRDKYLRCPIYRHNRKRLTTY